MPQTLEEIWATGISDLGAAASPDCTLKELMLTYFAAVGEFAGTGTLQAIQLPSYGSSSIDDGPRINLIFAANPGKLFQFTSGTTYTIATALAPTSNSVIYAYGATIKLKSGSNTANCMNISGSGTGSSPFITGVQVYGGTWDGNRANVTYQGVQYSENNGIYVTWAQNIRIHDVTTQNNNAEGILVGQSPCWNIELSNCQGTGNVDTNIFMYVGVGNARLNSCSSSSNAYGGVTAIRCDYLFMSNCVTNFNGPASSTEGSGITLQGCLHCSIADCKAFGNSAFDYELSNTVESGTGFSWSYQGAFATGTDYTVTQTVLYNNVAWYCYVATTGTQVPYIGSAYWAPCGGLAATFGGEVYGNDCTILDSDSSSPEAISSLGNYNNGTTYNPNDSVYYNGSVYVNYLQSTGNLPTNGTYWHIIDTSVSLQLVNNTNCAVKNFKSYNAQENGIFIQNGVSNLELDNVQVYGSGQIGISNPSQQATGNTHTSTTVDNLSGFYGVAVGDYITGTNIPNGTTVTAVNYGSNSITISNAATGSATGTTFTFYNGGTLTFNNVVVNNCGSAGSGGTQNGVEMACTDLRWNGGEVSNNTGQGIHCVSIGQANNWWVIDGVKIHDNGTSLNQQNGILWSAVTTGPNLLNYKVTRCDCISETTQQYRLAYETTNHNGIVEYNFTRNNQGLDYETNSVYTVIRGNNDFGTNPDHVSGTGTLTAGTTTTVSFASTMVAAPTLAGITLTFGGNPGGGASNANDPWITSISTTGFTINFPATASAVSYAYTARTGV